MTYEEAMEPGTVVDRYEAEREIKRHGQRFEEFAAEHGYHAQYESADVLGWLGY